MTVVTNSGQKFELTAVKATGEKEGWVASVRTPDGALVRTFSEVYPTQTMALSVAAVAVLAVFA